MKKSIDLTGQHFGRLTVLRRAGRNSSGNSKWECRCECGKTIVVVDSNLKRGTTRSCGCYQAEVAAKLYQEIGARSLVRMEGKVFGRLSVIARDGYNSCGKVMWKCVCVCGTYTSVCGGDLRNGRTRSCGCLQKSAQVTHGHSRRGNISREFRAWTAMIQRCENPRARSYAYYGGAGVKVCQRWRASFEAFLADLGPKLAGNTLGRDMDLGHYDPENCQWMTKAEQVAEQRKKRAVLKSIAVLSVLPVAA